MRGKQFEPLLRRRYSQRGDGFPAFVRFGFDERFQFTQRGNHRFFSKVFDRIRIGDEFATSRIRVGNEGSRYSEYDLENREEKLVQYCSNSRIPFKLQCGHRDSRENGRYGEYERVHKSLEQRHRNHIPVRYMSHFMADDSRYLVFIHMFEKSGRNRYQCRISGRSSSERVRQVVLVNSELRNFHIF